MGSHQPVITTRHTLGGVHRIMLSGAVGANVAGQLDTAVEEAIRRGATGIELDFALAWVVEPEDLICLVDVHRRTTRSRVELKLINVSVGVKEQMSRTLLP